MVLPEFVLSTICRTDVGQEPEVGQCFLRGGKFIFSLDVFTECSEFAVGSV